MSSGLVELQSMVDVGRPEVMEGFVGMQEDLELASLLDGEPVEVSQVRGDVRAFEEVQDEPGRRVLYGLDPPEELG